MINAHQKTTDDLKALLDSGKVKAMAATGDAQKKSFDELKYLSGKGFDEAIRTIRKKTRSIFSNAMARKATTRT